jgi:CopG family nickel-responsive transcriptional regulator
MKDPLVRFGVAIEGSLLGQLDALAGERGCTRSELLRDLARSAVGRAKVPKGVEAVGALTLVYDHHVRDLSRRLTDLQHELGDGVRSALHVHLSHDLCLEVVVMRGQSDQLQSIADRILAMRGVKQGGIEIIAGLASPQAAHEHEHEHGRGHEHAHTAPPRASRRRAQRTRRG